MSKEHWRELAPHEVIRRDDEWSTLLCKHWTAASLVDCLVGEGARFDGDSNASFVFRRRVRFEGAPMGHRWADAGEQDAQDISATLCRAMESKTEVVLEWHEEDNCCLMPWAEDPRKIKLDVSCEDCGATSGLVISCHQGPGGGHAWVCEGGCKSITVSFSLPDAPDWVLDDTRTDLEKMVAGDMPDVYAENRKNNPGPYGIGVESACSRAVLGASGIGISAPQPRVIMAEQYGEEFELSPEELRTNINKTLTKTHREEAE